MQMKSEEYIGSWFKKKKELKFRRTKSENPTIYSKKKNSNWMKKKTKSKRKKTVFFIIFLYFSWFSIFNNKIGFFTSFNGGGEFIGVWKREMQGKN